MKLQVTAALILCALIGCSGGNSVSEPGFDPDNGVPNTDETNGGGNTEGREDNSDTGSDAGENGGSDNSGGSDNGSGDNGGSSDNGEDNNVGDTGNDSGGSTGGDTGVDNGSDSGGPTGGPNNSGSAVANLRATHRSGQTFLTWSEVAGSAQYHVYRNSTPITSSNIASATRLTERWGPLDENTSVNRHGTDSAPSHFVIEDLASPLSDSTGLFVHTTQSGQNGNAYYAVTAVVNGNENLALSAGVNTLASAVSENVSTPRPVLTTSLNGGKGRLYTQFMDYANWNPTLEGYIYNYAVALPFNYNPSQTYPLQVELHAFGERHKFLEQSQLNWQVIQIFPSDPGVALNSLHTWWYGFATDHNYKTEGAIPFRGTVTNFTEQRILRAVNEVIADSAFSVDSNLVHAVGNSMGASGVLALGMRYGSKFAGIYASQPMTNYAASPTFQEELVQLWGEQSDNLPIVNAGPDSESIRRYGVGGNQQTGVWDWMNHLQQVSRRRSDSFAYLMVDHGKEDTTIDWQTQGRPVPRAFNEANIGFSAGGIANIGHTWLSFGAVVKNMFGLGFEELNPWRYSNDLSFPAISFASGSGNIDPGTAVTDRYNHNIEWSAPRFAFHQGIVDESSRYEITLRSTGSAQSATITPRNTRNFRPGAGRQCSWTTTRNSDNQQISSGNVTADSSSLVTVPGVTIGTGTGTRLAINC